MTDLGGDRAGELKVSWADLCYVLKTILTMRRDQLHFRRPQIPIVTRWETWRRVSLSSTLTLARVGGASMWSVEPTHCKTSSTTSLWCHWKVLALYRTDKLFKPTVHSLWKSKDFCTIQVVNAYLGSKVPFAISLIKGPFHVGCPILYCVSPAGELIPSLVPTN